MPRSPQDVYARQLSSPRGYPLWTPEPSNELLMKRREGLGIGDVGVVISDDGGFDVFFNICLPPDHPFHRRYGVPDGFTRIDPGELDIRTIADAENPGRVISSPSVTPIETAEPSSNTPQREQSTYRFSLSSDEGALLILPTGAERYDLLNEGLFLEQAKRHGLEWYNYAVNRRHRIIGYDSLYMITGIHKTRSWSVAAFEAVTGNEYHTARFKYTEGGSTSPTYSWETTRALDWRVGPLVDIGIPNQAVFIRGFKITLRSGLLGTRRITVEVDTPSTRSSPAKLSSSSRSNNSRLPGATLTGLLMNWRNNNLQAIAHSEGTTDPLTEERPQSDVPEDEYDDMSVEIQRIPDIHLAFHPSDAINQYLLRKEPSANIAITHDNHWISILEEGLLTLEELTNQSLLEVVLYQNYRIVSLEGIVHLERKSGTDVLDDDLPDASDVGVPDVLSWTNQDPRESKLFNSWGVLYRFQTLKSNSGQNITTLWRVVRNNKEDRVATLEWALNGSLGRVVLFSKNTVSVSDLIRPDPRYPGARIFNAPDGLQYRWRPSSTSHDVILEDPSGNIVAFFRPIRPTRYQIGDVYGELHFLRDAGAGTITHPPMMDTVVLTSMLYRFCEAVSL